jgi:SAM-dependent methyltransferase
MATEQMYRWRGFHLVRCPHCGYETVADLPTPEQLTAFYQSISGKKTVRSDRRLKMVARAFDSYLAEWKRHTGVEKPSRFLDLGGGVGYYARAGMDRGIASCLMDYAEDALQFSRDNLGISWIVAGDIQRCAEHLEKEEFDCVLARHVIEHMLDPDEFVRNVSMVMKPGGLLQVETPNVASKEQFGHPGVMLKHYRRILADNASLGSAGAFVRALKKPLSGVNPPKHLCGFTARSLSILLERNGFEVLSVREAPCGDRVYDPLYYDLHDLRGRNLVGVPVYFWERASALVFRGSGMNLALLARRRNARTV